MSTSPSTIDFLLDQLSNVPNTRARAMFGEYALYCNDKVVALICDDQLFVKITVPGKLQVGNHYEEGFPYPGAKAAMRIGDDLLDDREALSELILVTANALPAPKPRRKRTR